MIGRNGFNMLRATMRKLFLRLIEMLLKKHAFTLNNPVKKLLKAILIKRGMFIPIHDLSELAREVGIEEPILLNKLSKLTIHYYASRYPDAARRAMIKYDLNTAKECIDVMRKLWDTLRKYLE
jgi:Uncharacterized conserved protein related to C-terminal domain of eukaryotic chaperone, SACSIN